MLKYLCCGVMSRIMSKITFTYSHMIIFFQILSVDDLLGSWPNAPLFLGLFDSGEVTLFIIRFSLFIS